jgi:hypothetical protein
MNAPIARLISLASEYVSTGVPTKVAVQLAMLAMAKKDQLNYPGQAGRATDILIREAAIPILFTLLVWTDARPSGPNDV